MTPARRSLLCLLLVLSTVVLPAPAYARDDKFRWSVVPSSPSGPKGRSQFDYKLAPRDQIADWVGVSNLGAKPLTVEVCATDAFNAPDGGFALLPASQPPRNVGSWVSLPRRRFTVPPGKRADIPFRLKVPPNATPGDHIGGIVASVTEPETDAKGQRVSVERRVGARIYLRVAGPVHAAATLTAVEVDYTAPVFGVGGPMTVTYRLRNTGNVRVSGAARVQVRGPLGMRLATGELVDIPELLPDSEIRLTRRLTGVFPAGRLTAEVAVNAQTADGTLPPMSGSRSVPAVPWLVVGLLLVVLALLVFWWLRRRRARRLASPVPFSDLDSGATTRSAAGVGASRSLGVVLAAVAATGLTAPAAPAVPHRAAADPKPIELTVSVAPAPTGTPTPTPSRTTRPGQPSGGGLARTGLAVGAILLAGVMLVGGGTGLRLLARRRETPA